MCKPGLIFIFIFIAVNLLSACAPITVASMAGQALINTAVTTAVENHEENKIKAKKNHKIAVANYNVGVEYIREGNFDKALDRLDTAKKADHKYKPIYDALGVVYQHMNQPDKAEINFKEAMKLAPGDSDTLNNYGQFLCKTGREAEAEQYFLKAAANPLYQTPEIPFTNAGVCAQMHGQQEKAAKYLIRAISRNPRIPEALLRLAEISYDRGNFPSAHEFLKRYLKIEKQNPKSLWLGIRIEHKLGDKNAVSSYALLLRNDFPKTREAKLLRKSGLR